MFHNFVKLFLYVEAPEEVKSFVLKVYVAGINLKATPKNMLKVEEAVLYRWAFVNLLLKFKAPILNLLNIIRRWKVNMSIISGHSSSITY